MSVKTNTKRKPKRASITPKLVGKHLVVDPRVCHGELTFRGTRVPVTTILTCLAKGNSVAYLHQSWPEVSPAAIEEAINLAAEIIADSFSVRVAPRGR